MWASRCCARCGSSARVVRTTPQKLMFISQSICAWSISVKLPISATPALLMTMLRPGCAAMAASRECGDLVRLGNVDAMDRDFRRAGFSDFGRQRLQAGLIAIGQREIAAARGQFLRQRAADAAGSAGQGGRGATDRSHGNAPDRKRGT